MHRVSNHENAGKRDDFPAFLELDLLGWGQEHAVDHVNHTVAGVDVDGRDVGVIDLDFAASDGDAHRCALHGWHAATVQF